MFIHIQLKKKLKNVPNSLNSSIKRYDKDLNLTSYHNALPYVLEKEHKKSKSKIALCEFDVNYEVLNNELVLGSIDLNFCYVYPSFTDQGELLREVFDLIWNVFGEYSLYDTFTGKWYDFKDNEELEATSSLFSTTLTSSNSALIEMYKESFVANGENKGVFKYIKSYSSSFGLYILQDFYRTLLSQKQMTYEKSEEIIDKYLQLLKDIKDTGLKEMYMLKLLSPSKEIETRFIWLKPQTALAKLIELYKSFDISHEATQQLFLDFLIGITSLFQYKDFKDVTDELVQELVDTDVFIFKNILVSYKTYKDEGSIFQALKEYYGYLNKDKTYRKLFNSYKFKDPKEKTNAILSYESTLINKWYKQLNPIEKVAFTNDRWRYSTNLRDENTQGLLVGLTIGIGTLIYIFGKFNYLINLQGYVTKQGMIDGDIIAGMIVVSFIVQVLPMIWFWQLIKQIKERLNVGGDIVRKVVTNVFFVIPAIGFAILLSFLLLNSLFYSSENLTAVSNDKFVYRDVFYDFDKVSKVVFDNVYTNNRPIFDYPKISVIFNDSSKLVLTDRGISKMNTRASTCNMLKKFEQNLKKRNIPVFYEGSYKGISSICY